MKLSLSEQLILGILSEQARHGYDIEKIIIQRGMRKWAVVGFSSIYYVLERLEEKGLATGDDTQGNEKKQYSITNGGVSVLKAETKKRIAERMPANTHFMTGLATSDLIGASELAKSLEQRKVELASDLEALKEKQPKTCTYTQTNCQPRASSGNCIAAVFRFLVLRPALYSNERCSA